MRLSVIVPVYNMSRDDRLRFCLDALCAQTFPKEDYEILCVDDASTDDSFAIAKAYEEKTNGLVKAYRLDANHRQGAAKNAGLAKAKGIWISFIDADDWVTPDYYEKLIGLAEKEDADMAGCDLTMVETHTFTPGKIERNYKTEQCGVLDDEKRRSLLLDGGALVVNVYRRHVVYGAEEGKEHPLVFPEDMFYEDNAVASDFIMRARSFAYLPEALYFYLQHDDSTVHTVTMPRLMDRLEAGRILLAHANTNGARERCREETEYKFTRVFYVNTLFSAMQSRPAPKGVYAFCKKLAREMKETIPDFAHNPHYEARVHPEEKKLIAMQQQSHLKFYLYYRLLHAYRRVRYGK